MLDRSSRSIALLSGNGRQFRDGNRRPQTTCAQRITKTIRFFPWLVCDKAGLISGYAYSSAQGTCGVSLVGRRLGLRAGGASAVGGSAGRLYVIVRDPAAPRLLQRAGGHQPAQSCQRGAPRVDGPPTARRLPASASSAANGMTWGWWQVALRPRTGVPRNRAHFPRSAIGPNAMMRGRRLGVTSEKLDRGSSAEDFTGSGLVVLHLGPPAGSPRSPCP